MSTLQERLEEVMAAKGWKHADLVRVSRQSSSVVSQWLGKGSKAIKTIGKLEAALYIERESGYSALWLAKEMGPKFAPRGAVSAAEPPAQYTVPARVLEQMGHILANVPPALREAVAANLSGWARDGGADHWRIPLAALLEPASAKHAA